MTVTLNTLFFIGCIPTGLLVLLGFAKVLRNDRLIKKIIVLALLFASLGFFIQVEDKDVGPGFAPATLAAPLVYILSYTILRFIYKSLYKVEPTYNRSSWYDHEDNRRQNWLDVFVHLFPWLFSLIFPLFFLSK